MALNRKYAALPDLDSAPDLYETPELTDDNSTVPTTTVRSHSEDEFEDDDDEETGISRSRLRISQARSRFMPADVDATAVDFSDRVDGKRKSYKTSTRRGRILDDGTEEFGNLSDEDDEESLERKVARLKRELEEVKEEHAKLQAEAKTSSGKGAEQETQFTSLSDALDELAQSMDAAPERSIAATPKAPAPQKAAPGATGTEGATYTVTYAPTYEETHALVKAAEFDRRLHLLETAIGITSTAVPGVDPAGLPRAILPSLDALQRQLAVLAQAPTATLDTVSRKIRQLAQDTEELDKARALSRSDTAVLGASPLERDQDQDAKVSALYGTLPAIEGLAPLLPPLLDRLRSLRAVHADAAKAAETLERLERRQGEAAAELKQWREGLEKAEEAMREGTRAMDGNMKVMEAWVKELEGRMAKLS